MELVDSFILKNVIFFLEFLQIKKYDLFKIKFIVLAKCIYDKQISDIVSHNNCFPIFLCIFGRIFLNIQCNIDIH